MLVKQILKDKSPGVATIAPSETVATAAETLASRRIGALIVSEDGETVLGIISERDIVREIGRRGAVILGEAVSAISATRSPLPMPIASSRRAIASASSRMRA